MKTCTLCMFNGIALTFFALQGCASDPDTYYSTEPNAEYAITYLLSNFEDSTPKNAETYYRDVSPGGYHYTFDDPNSELDYLEPLAPESTACRTTEGLDTAALAKGDTDRPLVPPPPKCGVTKGLQINQTNPLIHFGSTFSLHMKGITANNGVGFGTYFSNYIFTPPRDKLNTNKYARDDGGNFPASFSNGRLNGEGQRVCDDDALFAGVAPSAYNSKKMVPYTNRFESDTQGKYTVTGSIYTTGEIYTDTDGVEHYELTHKNTGKLKEPRCLKDMGQKGFVIWATGNSSIVVTLNVPEATPIADGGLCDEDAGEKCYDFHRVIFKLDGNWREYHAAWGDFVQEGWGEPTIFNPNQIINVQVKIVPPPSGEPKEFDIWIDHIGFYGGETWAFVEQLADTEVLIIDTETN